MAHHTKDKGDIAVGMVVADLLINGYTYAPLISEHLPFDLIAIEQCGAYRTRKIQVRYASVKNGIILVKLANSYSDSNGVYTQTVDRNAFDAYSIFCPEVNQVYYLNTCEIPDELVRSYSLRIKSPKNNQIRGINLAADFLGVDRIFKN